MGFLGTLTRRAFVEGMAGNFAPHDAPSFTPDYPAFDEEYFEWIALFESVVDAGDAFTFVELGAGYGRWCVRAALAARTLRFQCVAVEAEPQHCLWLRDHFVDNGLSPADHDIRWAAVSGDPGLVAFATGQPDSWYGQAIRKRADTPYPSIAERRELMMRSVNGLPQQPSHVEQSIWVPCVIIPDLLAHYPRVDLLDVDIQGAEVRALRPAMKALNRRVRRVHIGTHSAELEVELRRMFLDQGWVSIADYPGQATSVTAYGPIAFGDGAQTWLNPRTIA